MTVVAVILAGGLARRMGGGDKALVNLGGRPMLDHVRERVRAQVGAMALNANGDPARFSAWQLDVLADPMPGHPGPLAGVLAGMLWARQMHPGATLLSAPTDAPFLPADLVARLAAARGSGIACARSRGQRHPVVALWPVALADALAEAIGAGVSGVAAFAARHGLTEVDFAAEPIDPFMNINDPAGLAAAAALLR